MAQSCKKIHPVLKLRVGVRCSRFWGLQIGLAEEIPAQAEHERDQPSGAGLFSLRH